MANDTTRGLNIGKIDAMQQAIVDYKKEIQRQVSKALNYEHYQTLVSKAIKGTNTQASLKKKITDIKTKESALVSQLDKWYDYLGTIKSQYQTQDQKFTF